MKQIIISRFHRSAVAAAVVAALGVLDVVQAGLNVPYEADAYTLHLWHFDDPVLVDGLTNIYVSDAVASGGITLTNCGLPTNLAPPYSNAFLGVPGFTGLGTCREATTKNSILYGGQFDDVSPFYDPATGAFTFEALVKLNTSPFSLPNHMEIITGDRSGDIGVRGWQFRINTAGQLEFNLLGGSGSDNDWKAELPKTGDNAAVAGQWYHVACTFTGTYPTNYDMPYELKFYWTLLDVNRTRASLLATFYMTRGLNGTVDTGVGTAAPWLGVAGSARNYPGTLGNGEGLTGLIDEVRISGVARASDGMAFVTGGALNPPSFNVQPPSSVVIGYGKTLTIPTIAVGTPELQYSWQFSADGGSFADLSTQTGNTLKVGDITFDATGAYRLVVANAYGKATSEVAQVTVGAAFSELFNTGVDASGAVDDVNLPTKPDPHYTLFRSADISYLGPDAIVWDMIAYPIASYGGNFANPDGKSQWIGPRANNYVSPVGQYIYRTVFVLDSVDLTKPATLSGIWWANEIGDDILLNGAPTGNSISAETSTAGKFSVPFVITSGFVPGINTLDFVTTRSPTANGSYQESALRVDMSDPVVELAAVGQALPPGKPVIQTQPASVTVREYGRAVFSVVALGRPPLTYQWYADGALLADATSRTLTFNPVYSGGQGTRFSVVVSNDSGPVTSAEALLTLTANRPPVAVNFNLVTYTNTPVDLSIIGAVYGATDPDNDPISFVTFDPYGTNGYSAVVQNGGVLTYTPPPDYVGADQYTYSISDGTDTVQGFVDIKVVLPVAPGLANPVVSGSNLILAGTGGLAGGGFSLLSSPFVEAPLAEWTLEITGAFDDSGGFSVTTALVPGVPRKFYVISVP